MMHDCPYCRRPVGLTPEQRDEILRSSATAPLMRKFGVTRRTIQREREKAQVDAHVKAYRKQKDMEFRLLKQQLNSRKHFTGLNPW